MTAIYEFNFLFFVAHCSSVSAVDAVMQPVEVTRETADQMDTAFLTAETPTMFEVMVIVCKHDALDLSMIVEGVVPEIMTASPLENWRQATPTELAFVAARLPRTVMTSIGMLHALDGRAQPVDAADENDPMTYRPFRVAVVLRNSMSLRLIARDQESSVLCPGDAILLVR